MADTEETTGAALALLRTREDRDLETERETGLAPERGVVTGTGTGTGTGTEVGIETETGKEGKERLSGRSPGQSAQQFRLCIICWVSSFFFFFCEK